ncbi:MAG: PH domain-containing protein, partial [Gammaproteobacteria bacterium]|nr:PH domain-containing protein [Gammaproteobacteria bacterium]
SGATMKIEGIRDPDTLRDFLYARMRGVREDTEEKLGKNNDLDDEALTLLREIRDELRNRRLPESGADD